MCVSASNGKTGDDLWATRGSGPLAPPPTCHSPVVSETRTYKVSLVLSGQPKTIDQFFKYRGEQLPDVGEVISVTRFLRGRVTRARVTRVDVRSDPPIAATQID